MALNQEVFESEIKQKREEDIEPLVSEALKKMFEHDMKLGDSVYIYNRVLQIVHETIRKLDFKNETIAKARRAFLDVLLDGMQGNMFTIEDEMKQARKDIQQAKKEKDSDKRHKAVNRLKQLERIRDMNPQDSTDERDIECEPICQYLAKTILSSEWILKDDNYLSKAIEFDDELLITIPAVGYTNLLFDKVAYALDMSHAKANEKIWGKEKRHIRMKELDKKLQDE